MGGVMLGEAEYIRQFCEGELNSIPSTWASVPFDILVDDKTDSRKKIPKSEFLSKGEIPIVDQGQLLVAGYTNDASKSRKFEKPVVVFGDHTLAFKFIEFEFAQGADGVRVLCPNGFLDSKYIYYYFIYLPLPNKGYSRHYKFLKRCQIPLPPLGEQLRISKKVESSLSKIDSTVQNLTKVESLLKKYQESLLAKAFRGELIPQDPNDEPATMLLEKIRAERKANQKGKKKNQKPAPISDEEKPFDIPESWEWVRIGELGVWSGGGTPSKQNEKYWLDGSISWISPKDMKTDYISTSQNSITKFAVKDKGICLLKPGAILIVTRSGILRHSLPVALAATECAINQDIKALQPDRLCSPEYVFYFLKAMEKSILRDSSKKGATVESIDFEKFRSTLVPLPPIAEQSLLTQMLESKLDLCSKIESFFKSQKVNIKKLRESILEKAFRGDLVQQIDTEGTGHELLEKILLKREDGSKKVRKKSTRKRR